MKKFNSQKAAGFLRRHTLRSVFLVRAFAVTLQADTAQKLKGIIGAAD